MQNRAYISTVTQAATVNAFMAIAESARRDILMALGSGERSVNDLVGALDLPQPRVSQHLATLRTAGLVRSRAQGRQRLYAVDTTALEPVAAWLSAFESTWNERLDRFDDVLNELQQEATDTSDGDSA
jgi:DNA-binding transcriptional ArsR family regulator